MKKKELWKLSNEEVEKRLKEARAQLSKEMSKKAASGAPSKPSVIRNLRKLIAQFLTVLSLNNKKQGVKKK